MTAAITSSSELELLGPYDQCFYKDGQFFSLWLIQNVLKQYPNIEAVSLRYDVSSGDIEAYIETAAEELSANQLNRMVSLANADSYAAKAFLS